MRIIDPGEAIECAHLELLGHHAKGAWIDVPAGHGDGHVARAFAQFLHDSAGAGGVILDAAVEFLEVSPGLVPAGDRIFRVLVTQQIWQAHQEGAAGAGVGRTGVDQLVGIGLAPAQQFSRGFGRCFDLVGVVFEQWAGWHVGHHNALAVGQSLHSDRRAQVVVHQPREFGRMGRQQGLPQIERDTGRQCVGAGQHQINIGAASRLHGADFCWQLGCWRLGEGDA